MSVKSQHDRGIMRRFLLEAIGNRVEKVKRQRRRQKRDKWPDNRPHAALVFGAGDSHGIGDAIAARAAAGGMKAYVTGLHAEKLNATASAIRHAGHQAEIITVDLTRPEQIHAAFETVRADGCRLELVVHSGGTRHATPFLDITPEDLEERWEVDCRSGFVIGREAISTMLGQPSSERGLGTILFSSTSDSLRGQEGFAAFAQAKAGLRMLSQALAREFGPEGIHTAHSIIDNAICGARKCESAENPVDAQDVGRALHPAAIAETYWNICQQHRSAWTHEIELASLMTR